MPYVWGKPAHEVIAENGYLTDDLDRDALRARNREILLARGFSPADADAILDREPPKETRRGVLPYLRLRPEY